MVSFLRTRTGRRLSTTTCSAIALILAGAFLTQSTATLAQAPAETVIPICPWNPSLDPL